MIFGKKSSRHLTVAGPIMGRRSLFAVRRSYTLNDALDYSEPRSRDATAAGAQAFARPLTLAETRDSGQIPRIARFLAATYNGQAFQLDVFKPRAVDIAISNDMLCCLDALRCGRADLHTLIPDGDARMRAVIERWGLARPTDA